MNPFNLSPDQFAAVKNMKDKCILCGGVGSGKSRTALAYYYKEQGGSLSSGKRMVNPRDLYVITTAKKRDTKEWLDEMLPFRIGPNSPIYSNKVVVDSWNNIKKYKDVYGAFFIFDEQRLVGAGAWVKAFYNIARKNKWVLLSATPGDNWKDYIPVFVANGFYKNKTEFEREHVVYKVGPSYPVIDRYISTGKLNRLRRDILVNLDDHRATIPHHQEIITNYNKVLYKDIAVNRWNIYDQEPIKNASEYCYTLRRLVNSDPSKLVALVDILEHHPKVIVFYNFNYELDMLRSLELSDWVDISEWNGSKHEPIPTGDYWMYLVQYSAGCEGWNCIDTDAMVFFSPNYSYRVMTQAAGRIDRMNTPYKDLYYYHLMTKSPIDVKIRRCLASKKDFNASAFCRDHIKFSEE